MNKRPKWTLLALAPLVLSAALIWANWKRNNPIPTRHDLALRQRLISAKEVYIFYSPPTGNKSFFHNLSPEGRQEVARHIWILQPDNFSFAKNRNILLRWGTPNQPTETIYLDDTSPHDFYEGRMPPGAVLHPATRAFLRQWIKAQSSIQKQLNRK